MINSWQNAVVITSGLVLSLAVQQVNPAQAAVINYNLAGTIQNGALTGQTFSGTFSYDNSPLTGSSFETLGVSKLNLNFLGSTFTAANDDSYPDGPTVEFLDGNFLGLSFTVSSFTPEFSLIPAFGNTVATFSYIGTNDSGSGSIEYKVVPEPSTLAGAGLACFGLSALGRKRKSN